MSDWLARLNSPPADGVVVGEYAALYKPLPLPPPGNSWLKRPDGMWELIDVVKPEAADPSSAGAAPSEARAYVEHVVTPDDTLAGICLRYKVTPARLRQINRFSGEQFRMCETLWIPVGVAGQSGPRVEPADEQNAAIQCLQELAGGLGAAECRVYLEDAGWDVQRALAAWRDDEVWEKGGVSAANPPQHLRRR